MTFVRLTVETTPSITSDVDWITGFVPFAIVAATLTELPIAKVEEGVIEPWTLTPVAVPSARWNYGKG